MAFLVSLLHFCRHRFWRSALQGECHFRHNESLRQRRPSISEPHRSARELLESAVRTHPGNHFDYLTQFAAESARIHEESAADTAWNALGEFDAAVAFRH